MDNNNNNNDKSDKIDKIQKQFSIINDNLTLFKMQITNLQKHIKTVEKDFKKELKNVKQSTKEKKQRSPSGFAKPTKVSAELSHFMDLPEGTLVARTQVTKILVKYIQENNLFDKSHSKSIIIPDHKLINLLGITNTNDKLTYFTIQKYMNKHFL